MDLLLLLDRATFRWLRMLALVGFSVLVAEAAIVTLDALLRSFANAPIRGLSEVVDVTTAIVIATCFPIVISQRRNIKLGFLSHSLPNRGRAAVAVFSNAMLLVFVIVISIALVRYAREVVELGETSLVRQIPLGPFWLIASAIVVLSVPAQGIVLAGCVAELLTGKKIAHDGVAGGATDQA